MCEKDVEKSPKSKSLTRTYTYYMSSGVCKIFDPTEIIIKRVVILYILSQLGENMHTFYQLGKNMLFPLFISPLNIFFPQPVIWVEYKPPYMSLKINNS